MSGREKGWADAAKPPVDQSPADGSDPKAEKAMKPDQSVKGFAGAAGRFDLGAGGSCERRGLHRQVLGGEFTITEHLEGMLGARHDAVFDEGVQIHGGSVLEIFQGRHVQHREVLRVNERKMLQLGHPAVQRHLSTFKPRTGWSAGAGFLATHAEAAASTLTSGNATALAQFAATSAFVGFEGVESESHRESGVDLLEGDSPFFCSLLMGTKTG